LGFSKELVMSRSKKRPDSLIHSLNRDYLILSLAPFIFFLVATLTGAYLAQRHLAGLIDGSMRELGEEIKSNLIHTGENAISGRAREVAGQIDLVIASHPGITIEELQQRRDVAGIAVQQVGQTGYTCLYEAGSGVMRFHPNPDLVNSDMNTLAGRLPSWWRIFEPSLGGAEVSGYYDWLERDGSTTPKFMTMTPVPTPVGGRRLMVAATTYMGEFLEPVNVTQESARRISGQYRRYISGQTGLICAAMALTLAAAFFLVFRLSRRAAVRFVLPIEQLAESTTQFGRDMNTDDPLPPTIGRSDEIGDLTRAFNRMRFQIADQFARIKSAYEKLRETQRALKESEAHYRSLFDHVPIGIYRTEPGGRVIDANPALVEMFGYPDKESLLACPASEMYAHPGDREIFKERVAGFGAGKPCEFQMRARDGRSFWVENRGVPVRDGEGRIGYYEGTLKDVTQSKIAGEALRLSEERFRAAFENAAVGMTLVGPDNVFLEVNAAFADMVGRSQAELVGKPVVYVLHPEEVLPRRKFMEDLVSGTTLGRQVERRLMHRNGSVVWALVWTSLKRDADGKPLYFISLIQDITERRKAEEELRLARFCIDNAAVSIFRLDEDARILEANAHACRSLGYSRRELLGMTLQDIDPAFSRPRWEQHRRSIAAARVLTLQSRHRRKDGTGVPVDITANTLERDGQVFSYFFVTDVSGRVEAERNREKLEAQLQQAQKMEAIGTLAGGISHDFNNILGVIIGNANILEISESMTAADMPHVKQILAASDRARKLVRQILAFSRRGDQERLIVNLKPVVKETMNFLKSTLPGTIEVRQSIRTDAAILADPTQMQQVLMNLSTNAAHAMESRETGVLEIGLEKITLSPEEAQFIPEAEPGEFVRLTVTDTGTGIDTHVRERMFEPYFTTKGPGKGTGLGLSVVHGIAKAHGGFIKVDSETGKGTRFHVYFPAVSEGERPASEASAGMLPKGSETLLLVDDEIALAEMARQMLAHLGYRVEIRTSPLDAIEAFRAHPDRYQAVVTDMSMPQMNGVNLSKKLLEIRPQLPILLCTGFSDQADREKARAAGIREFAFKPLAMQDLARIVRQMLDEAGNTRATPPAQGRRRDGDKTFTRGPAGCG
jgi:PAS domain S-box-containing protein